MSDNKLADALRALLNDGGPAAVGAAHEALAEHEGFSICLQKFGDTGTHITFQAAKTEEEAIALAKDECLNDWDDETTLDDLHVLAVMRGDFDILRWDDQE